MTAPVYEHPGPQDYDAEPAPPTPDETKASPDAWDYQRPCDQPKTREQADLCQQWRMAKASEDVVDWASQQYRMTAAEVLLLVATVAFTGWAAYGAREAAVETRRAANAAIESNRISRELGAQQIRAYIDAADIRVRNFAPGMRAVFKCSIKNAGSTPAYNLRIFVVACDSADSNGEIRFCGRKPSSTATVAGHTAVENNTELVIPHDLYEAVKAGKATILVAGYIKYRDISKVRRGVTFKTYLRFADIKNGAGAMTAAGRNNYAN